MEDDERTRMRFVPYEDIAKEYAKELGRSVQFISFPIQGKLYTRLSVLPVFVAPILHTEYIERDAFLSILHVNFHL